MYIQVEGITNKLNGVYTVTVEHADEADASGMPIYKSDRFVLWFSQSRQVWNLGSFTEYWEGASVDVECPEKVTTWTHEIDTDFTIEIVAGNKHNVILFCHIGN